MEDFPLEDLPDTPNWSENYALAGFDPHHGIDVFLALGRWRQDLTLWREMITIALPDGTVLGHRAVGDARADGRHPGGTNLALRIVEDGRRQRWSFLGAMRRVASGTLEHDLLHHGPLVRTEFTFEFGSALPLWDLGGGGQQSAVAGHAHVEQLGRTCAQIRVGSETLAFDSEVNRDHSRGPRLVGAVTRHAWFHAVFDNGMRVQAYEMFEGDEVDVPRFSKAVVSDAGRLMPATMIFGPALPDADPLSHVHDPLGITLGWEDRTVEMQIVAFPTTVHVQQTAPWDNYIGARQVGPDQNRRVVEQSTICVLADGTKGYGHIERTVPGRILADAELL